MPTIMPTQFIVTCIFVKCHRIFLSVMFKFSINCFFYQNLLSNATETNKTVAASEVFIVNKIIHIKEPFSCAIQENNVE